MKILNKGHNCMNLNYQSMASNTNLLHKLPEALEAKQFSAFILSIVSACGAIKPEHS